MNFTIKTLEALQQAQLLAKQYKHTELHPYHIIYSLLEQEG